MTVITFPGSRRHTPANDVIAIAPQHRARTYVPPAIDAVKAAEVEEYLTYYLAATAKRTIEHVGQARAAELLERTAALIRAGITPAA